mmetsp:Transcript_98017/g.305257  ORF Transcript_98017/g.305257 Transcript_98017/m.305257 type:complete len:103 (+) Transcript_98017:552-860(+)
MPPSELRALGGVTPTSAGGEGCLIRAGSVDRTLAGCEGLLRFGCGLRAAPWGGEPPDGPSGAEGGVLLGDRAPACEVAPPPITKSPEPLQAASPEGAGDEET